MRHIDTDRLRALADRRPGPVRRALSSVLFHAQDLATGIAVGGIVGVLFLVCGMSALLSTVLGLAVAVVVTRLSIRAWERAAGLTRVRTTHEDDVELNDTDDTDVDDVATAEPARTSDSPEVAAAR